MKDLQKIQKLVPVCLNTNLSNLIQDCTRIIEAETQSYQVSVVLTPIEEDSNCNQNVVKN